MEGVAMAKDRLAARSRVRAVMLASGFWNSVAIIPPR